MSSESLTQSAAVAAVDLEETYWWYRARRKIITDTVQRYLQPGSDIIDFGCGSGITARRLVDLGYKVLAADISTPALAACRQRGLNTLDVSQGWPAPASGDCILAGDVLEHVDDDVGLLRKLKLTLRPGGLIIAAVPAYDFLWSGEDYISEHFRRYTRSRLENRMRDAGFVVEWSSYFNTFLLVPVIAAVFYKRLLRPRDMYRTDIEPLPDWLNNMLYRIFVSERSILPHFRFPAGASILLVGRA